MASTRAVPGDGDGNNADLLGSAAALRWSRPDLTGAIADHVLEIAEADSDHALWLRAAGWAVSARSATGDGRPTASEVLDGVVRRGAHVLDEPAADRLRVELALLATAAGRLGVARALLTPVSVADTGPALRADALGALARCAVEDRPAAVDGLLRRVESTWAEVGGPRGHIGTAAASLVAATAERRAGRPGSALDKAAEGLAHLDRARGGRTQSPSRHLAAGLAAEWISGLLDAGRAAEARDGCVPLEPRLRDTSRPSRQMALLRLAVARTVAGSGADAVVAALTQAARDAATSDAPDLESLCLSTLGALQQKAGQIEQGVESIHLGAAAQRRDQQRAERFRMALDVAVSADPTERPSRKRPVAAAAQRGADGARPGHRRSEGLEPLVSRTGGPWTDWSSAVARDQPPVPAPIAGTGNGSGRSQPLAGAPADGSGPTVTGSNRRRSAGNGRAVDDEVTDPHGFSAWQGWSDDSPIGHLLAQSLRPAEPGSHDTGDAAPPTPDEGQLRPGESRASRRGQRRYPDVVADPWSTGAWSTGHWATKDKPGDDAAAPSSAPAGRGGRRRRAEPEDEVTDTPAAVTHDPLTGPLPVGDRPSTWYDQYEQSTRSATAAADRDEADRDETAERAADIAVDPGSGSWLQNALAELDRTWGASPAAPAPGNRQPEPKPEADGCVVVIDLARDGRRFAGRRAGAVVRALGDRLTDRLPSGGRLRHDDGDALSVVLPGWRRSPATEWMHRTLPGLFEEFVTDEEMPGTQLRAAVHDIDGPVGAQLLQRLDSRRRRHATRDVSSTGPLWGSLPAVPDARPTDAGRRHRRWAEEQPEAAATGQDAPPAAARAEQFESTDGLGLADLLAGALAAYRGI